MYTQPPQKREREREEEEEEGKKKYLKNELALRDQTICVDLFYHGVNICCDVGIRLGHFPDRDMNVAHGVRLEFDTPGKFLDERGNGEIN